MEIWNPERLPDGTTIQGAEAAYRAAYIKLGFNDCRDKSLEALELLQKAERLHGRMTPAIAFRMAQCYERLGYPTKALNFYKLSLEDTDEGTLETTLKLDAFQAISRLLTDISHTQMRIGNLLDS